MKAWTDLYKELAEIISANIDTIQWVDLWHEQVSYLTDELPFPAPAVFLAFTTNQCEDISQLIQECDVQINFYLFFETFADTYVGASNQESALEFLNLLTELHKTFHGRSGTNFQEMRRVDTRREETGGAGNLYRISFNCLIEDASAKEIHNNKTVQEVEISNTPIPQEESTIKTDFILPNNKKG